jgi:DNA processing protein
MSTVPSFFSNITESEILSLAAIESISPAAWHKIYQEYRRLRDALEDSAKNVLSSDQSNALKNRELDQRRQLEYLKKLNINIVLLGSRHYPKLLAEITDPPLWLFYRGDLSVLERPTISIVGSRKCSAYGISVIETLLPATLIANLTTISGLAYGIDKKIHERSLKFGGKTVAVMAGGLDQIYPAEHTQLADNIVFKGGLLLSEYPPLSRPRGYKFPIRNRIIAGLSPLTVVIEAAVKSGSLTTAKSALDYNRDLMAVPGDITRSSSTGTNFLIQQGAIALTTSEQLFEYFGLKNQEVAVSGLDSDLAQVLDLLTQNPKNIEELAVVVGKPIEVVLGLVTQLELINQVYQPKPGYYLRKK